MYEISDLIQTLDVNGPKGWDCAIWTNMISDLYYELTLYYNLLKVYDFDPSPEVRHRLAKECADAIGRRILLSHIHFDATTRGFLIKTLYKRTDQFWRSPITILENSLEPGAGYFVIASGTYSGDELAFLEKIDFKINVLPHLFKISIEASLATQSIINHRIRGNAAVVDWMRKVGALALWQEQRSRASPVNLYFDKEDDAVLAKLKI